MEEPVSVERNEDIATLLLNRPSRLNALDLGMAQSLLHLLQELRHDHRTSAIVITGSGRAFCAGGDLRWVREQAAGVGASFHLLAGCFHQSVIEIASIEKPVIAAVNGVAAGAGFSLALACDFRVMDRTATLKQAYTSAGLSIDGGGTFALPRLIGLARALEIAAIDAPISAEQALAMGLVTRLADVGRAAEEAQSFASDISKQSLTSFGWSKRLLRNSFQNGLEAQLEWERRGIAACGASPEGQEGLDAFINKRAPEFRQVRDQRFSR